MSVTKPEIEIHSTPQGIKTPDTRVDELVDEICDRFIQRLDMWGRRLASRIDAFETRATLMETRVNLVTGGYQGRADGIYRGDGIGGFRPGNADFRAFPRISEERRTDGSLIPWSSGS